MQRPGLDSTTTKTHFRALYRQFLFRVIDLELLSQKGDTSKLLGQFAALLVFCSLWLSGIAGMAKGLSRGNSLLGIVYLWMSQHFLISTTMLTVGLFAVMSWESVFPDRRDVLVLSPLPVRTRTLLAAKVVAVATALGVTVAALNSLTGVFLPWGFAAQDGLMSGLRAFGAYWAVQVAAGIFILCSLITVQGLAQLLPRQMFLRASSWLQMALFITMLTVYFLQPPFSDVQDLLPNLRTLGWIPSYWFLGLFHQLNGTLSPPLAFLAPRAWTGLGVAFGGAAAAYFTSYFRTIRMIAEQPDLLPGPAGVRWAPRFGDSFQTAIGQFSVRSLLRSRHHRIMLTFYVGVGLGLAMFISHTPAFYLRASGFGDWYRLNASLLVASAVIMCAAMLGIRVVFSIPLEMRANWIFRTVITEGISGSLAATRRSLYALSAVPVWLICAALFLWLWPWRVAVEHLILLAAFGAIMAELCLHRFHKLPFTCSYLPGRTQFNMALVYLALFLLIVDWASDREMAALSDPVLYAITLTILVTIAVLAGRRTVAAAQSENGQVTFDEAPEPAVYALNLHRDGITIIPKQ